MIQVIDKGAGFQPESIAASADVQTGFGLASVREHLQLFGGHIQIQLAPGASTEVTIFFPLLAQPNENRL